MFHCLESVRLLLRRHSFMPVRANSLHFFNMPLEDGGGAGGGGGGPAMKCYLMSNLDVRLPPPRLPASSPTDVTDLSVSALLFLG